MDLRQLKYFKTIVEEKSITKAADKLHMAQPPLSQQLKRLESELNTTLIKRYRADWELTDTGRFLYEHAQKILVDLDFIHHEISMMTDGVKGTLAIGVASSCSAMLPSIIRVFREKYPAVYIKIHEGDSSYLESLLIQNKIDLALMLSPTNSGAFHITALNQIPFTAVMPINLYGAPSITLEKLNKYPILMLGQMDGYSLHETIIDYFTKENLIANTVLECKDIFTLLNLVAEESGVAILPQSEVQPIFEKRLKIVAIENLNQSITPSIVSIKDYPQTTLATAFTVELQALAEKKA